MSDSVTPWTAAGQFSLTHLTNSKNLNSWSKDSINTARREIRYQLGRRHQQLIEKKNRNQEYVFITSIKKGYIYNSGGPWASMKTNLLIYHHLVQFSHSVVSNSLWPQNCSTPGLPVHHQLPEYTQTHVHRVGDAIQPSHPLLSPFPPAPNPPSITVFFSESTLRIRWPKYWSFSFSIIPSKEIPGLISFRIDWLDLLAVQGTLKNL